MPEMLVRSSIANKVIGQHRTVIPTRRLDAKRALLSRTWLAFGRMIKDQPQVDMIIFSSSIFKTGDEIGAIFRELAKSWNAEVGMLSNPTKKFMHIKYQQIIGLGPQVVPYMLKDLASGNGSWFWALIAITRDDPVSPNDAGKMKQMASAWLEWGKQRGLADDSEHDRDRISETLQRQLQNYEQWDNGL
ncbi:MAG TPA: hypothetical protein VMG59_02380 [Phycisphaerae bacterium]|nr:hypothetical protein [Phycisphaerae bacterium]